MRDELHLMELVDRYLDGSMNEADRAAFETRAGASKELRQLIEDQRAMREGVQRLHLRGIAQKASPKGGPGGSVAGLFAILAIIGASYLLWNTGSEVKLGGPGVEEAQPSETYTAAPSEDVLPDTPVHVQRSRTQRIDTTWVVKKIVVPIQASESAGIEHVADSLRRTSRADSVFVKPRTMHPDSVKKLLQGRRAPSLN